MTNAGRLEDVLLQRVIDLWGDAESCAESMARADSQARSRAAANNVSHPGSYYVEVGYFEEVRVRTMNLIASLVPAAPHLAALVERVGDMKPVPSSGRQLAGIIQGIRKDLEAGLLRRLEVSVQDAIVADYLVMADELFSGEGGPMRHVPAAVLAGAVLEDGLRRLCERHQPAIPVVLDSGKYKKMTVMIDDLKSAGAYNELKAKQLRAWADIRNAAAHGQFDQFNAADVGAMLSGIRTFLTEHM